MENKKIVAIIVAVLALIALVVVVLVNNTKKQTQSNDIKPLKVETTEESKQLVQKPTDAANQAKPEVIQKVGTVSMVDPAFLTIEVIDGSLQSAITKDTKFVKRVESGNTPITASDVKVRMNVMLKLNSLTGEILEVEVI